LACTAVHSIVLRLTAQTSEAAPSVSQNITLHLTTSRMSVDPRVGCSAF